MAKANSQNLANNINEMIKELNLIANDNEAINNFFPSLEAV